MKKSLKDRESPEGASAGQDLEGIILKIQEQLISMERKIDALIGKSQEKPAQSSEQPKSFQRFDRFQRRDEARPNNGFRDRTMHRAICADCGNGCEVPFKPSGERPVYCKDCFGKRKTGSQVGGQAPSPAARHQSSHAASHAPRHANPRYEKKPREEKSGKEPFYERYRRGSGKGRTDKKRAGMKRRKKG